MAIEDAVKDNYLTISKLLELQGLEEGKINLINSLYNISENISSKRVCYYGQKMVFHNWFKKRIPSEEEFIKYLNKNGAKLGEKKKALLQPRYKDCLIQSRENNFYMIEVIGNNENWHGGFDFAFHNPEPKTINL